MPFHHLPSQSKLHWLWNFTWSYNLLFLAIASIPISQRFPLNLWKFSKARVILSPRPLFTILCSKANDDFVSSVICVYLCLVLSFSEITLKFWKWTMFLKYQQCLRNLSRRRKFPCQFQSLRKPLLLEVGFVSCLWQKSLSQWILFPTWCLLVLTPCLSLDRISVCVYLWYVTCFPLC